MLRSQTKIIDPLVPKNISRGGDLLSLPFFQARGAGVANEGLERGVRS